MECDGDARRQCLRPQGRWPRDASGRNEHRASGPFCHSGTIKVAHLRSAHSRGFSVALALHGQRFVAAPRQEINAPIPCAAAVFHFPAIAPEPPPDFCLELARRKFPQSFERPPCYAPPVRSMYSQQRDRRQCHQAGHGDPAQASHISPRHDCEPNGKEQESSCHN